MFIPPHDAGVKRFNPMKVGRNRPICAWCVFFSSSFSRFRKLWLFWGTIVNRTKYC